MTANHYTRLYCSPTKRRDGWTYSSAVAAVRKLAVVHEMYCGRAASKQRTNTFRCGGISKLRVHVVEQEHGDIHEQRGR